MMETAIHEASILQTFNELKKTPTQDVTEAEKIRGLASDDGFKALQVVIDRTIEHLGTMRDSVTSTSTVADIGFRFLATQTAIEHLKWVRDLPEALYKSWQKAK